MQNNKIFQLIISITLLFLSTGCINNIDTSPTNKLTTLITLLNEEYVDEINNSKLTNDAIHNIIKTLDVHSHYLSSNALKNLFSSIHGEFTGIGISMGIHNSLLTILSSIPNSPATKIGLRSGDIIIKINTHDTLGLSLNQCVALTRGKIGTDLNLTVVRNNTKQPLRFSIKRKNIDINIPTAQMLKDDILYICVPSFNEKSSAYVYYLLQKFTHYKKLILDLRFNPGGILSQAVSFVNMFIDKGLIVTQKGRHQKYYEEFWATKESSDIQHPMVVLINKYSASASEIVAGALQVHKRATIIGEKSFGKGSVQTLFSLDDKSAIKLTIAKYYLPNGKCIHDIGIKPDIFIRNTFSNSYKIRTTFNKKSIKKLLNSLKKGKIKAIRITKNPTTHTGVSLTLLSKQDIQHDKQLLKAIQVLRNSN